MTEHDFPELPARDAVARVPEHVVYRSFADEILLLNLQTGQYHGLNETGGRLIELLSTMRGGLDAAISALAAEYDEPASAIEGQMLAFCADLEERGLLEITPPTGAA